MAMSSSPAASAAPVTATALTYLKICRRKLWLHAHGIKLENAHVNVKIGKHIQNTTFDRKEKDIALGDVGVIDWAEFKHGILHETKKGKTPAAADELQVKYYMVWMRDHGIDIRGARIHYPKQKRTKEIEWNNAFHHEVGDALTEARKIVAEDRPPPVVKLPYCKSCAFFEFCFS